MNSSQVINSAPCFGTPYMPSSGRLRSCYHRILKWSVLC